MKGPKNGNMQRLATNNELVEIQMANQATATNTSRDVHMRTSLGCHIVTIEARQAPASPLLAALQPALAVWGLQNAAICKTAARPSHLS
mmetsp:Transcript_8053/g.16988  ORF Transcript_8053/g.16988 Transcript_8053/m.16988 type:complete len:89 (+) Transcript_8053:2039-2305(+)